MKKSDPADSNARLDVPNSRPLKYGSSGSLRRAHDDRAVGTVEEQIKRIQNGRTTQIDRPPER